LDIIAQVRDFGLGTGGVKSRNGYREHQNQDANHGTDQNLLPDRTISEKPVEKIALHTFPQ
jgi:hypothetical protein